MSNLFGQVWGWVRSVMTRLAWRAAVSTAALLLAATGAARAQGFEWAVKAGGINPPPVANAVQIDWGFAVAVDRAGDVYVVGGFAGTAPFDGQSVTSAGGSDGFIAKYAPDGRLRWVKSYGGAGDDLFRRLTIDADGNLLVLGTYRARIGFGSVVLQSSAPTRDSGFIAKFDPEGRALWAVGLDSVGTTGLNASSLSGLRVDPSGQVLVAGWFNGTLSVGSQTLVSAGSSDGIIVRLGAQGELLWVRRYGGTDREAFYGIDIDAQGRLVVAGGFSGTLTLGSSTLTSAGGSDGFWGTFTANGEPLWAVATATGAGAANVFGAALAPNGDVVLTGRFAGSARFDTVELSNATAQQSGFVARYRPDGRFAWATSMLSSDGFSDVNQLVFDRWGRVLALGSLTGSIQFPGGVRSDGIDGLQRPYAAVLDPGTGRVAWFLTGTGTVVNRDNASFFGAALAADGALYATGLLGGTMSFGTTQLTTGVSLASPDSSDLDILVARLRLPAPPPNGDFNGDNKPDLLWQNVVTGERAFWFLDGVRFGGGGGLGVLPADWRMAGTADFDGDGRTDIVLQNRVTGERAIWLMNGATLVSGVGLGTVPPAWEIAAVADLNGDGKADLVWQNLETGERAVWFMDGSRFQGAAGLGVVPREWVIAAAGDIDGDGKADLVLEHLGTGTRYVWLMDFAGAAGLNIKGGATLTTLPPEWRIARLGDFDGDGKTDVVWENRRTGERVVWLLDGLTLKGGSNLGTVPSDWQIVK